MYSKLVLAFALILISASTSAQELPEIIDSGICGETAEDCNWSLDANGKLTITGTGEMKDYEPNDQHFGSRTKVKEVEMSGITKIGLYAFRGYDQITNLTIPASVEVIDRGALQIMPALTTVNFQDGSKLKRLEGTNFFRDTALEILQLPDSLEFLGYVNFKESGIKSLVLPESLFKDGKLNVAYSALNSGMKIYCPKEHQQECEDYLKTAKTDIGGDVYVPLENTNLQTYEQDGETYFIGNKWYKHPNDVLTGKHIKKLRYTIEEAMKATEKGDKFHVSLTYK